MKKELLIAFGIILLIPGLGNLAGAIMLKSQNPQLALLYSNVVSGRICFAVIFIIIANNTFCTVMKTSKLKSQF